MQGTTYFEVKDFTYDPKTRDTLVRVRKSQDVTIRAHLVMLPEHRLKHELERSLQPDHSDIPHNLRSVSQLVHSLNKPGVNAFDVIQVLGQVDYLLSSIESTLKPNKVPDIHIVRNKALEEVLRMNNSNSPYTAVPVRF